MQNGTETTFYPVDTLSSDLADKGLAFIRRRFLEAWNVFRSDVDKKRILNRDNIVLMQNNQVTGWLGLEPDGELANACIEKGLHGVPLLASMIRKIYDATAAEYYYAETPIIKSGSARAFLMSGMHLVIPPLLYEIKYYEKRIVLARLEVYRSENPTFDIAPPGIVQTLNLIKGIQENVKSYPKTF